MLPVYLLLALIARRKTEQLLLLPDIKVFGISLYPAAFRALLILLGVLGLLTVIYAIRRPLFLNLIIQRRFRKIGFRNSEGEVPVLVSRRRDKRKPHGLAYTFNNKGLSIELFDRKISQIQVMLNGFAYEITPGKRNMKKTIVYILPKKYEKPSIISATDIFLTRDLINLLCVGRTGSGKSYALTVLLASIARFTPNASITICDYKKSSFAQFEDTPNFYGYEAVPDGIEAFYKEFTERLTANDEQRNAQIRVVLIDEYGAMIAAQEKKKADELKTMVANMLFMGRSLGIRVLIGVQRADAEHFKAGARDQFKTILAMGNLSKEQKQMLFADYKDNMTANNELGEGYVLVDGKGIERVKVMPVSDFESLNSVIRQAMNR